MTDATEPNGDRERFSDREAALDRNDRPHRRDQLEAAHKKSGKTRKAG